MEGSLVRYDHCLDIFAAARCSQPRLCNNTRLRQRPVGSDPADIRATGLGPVFCVRYHCTDIVEVFRNGRYRIDTGGWNTITTCQRINWFSPASVYREAGIAYLSGCDHTGAPREGWRGSPGADVLAKDDRFPLYPGVIVNSTGRPIEACPESYLSDMRQAHENRRAARREFSRGYARRRRAILRWQEFQDGERSRESIPMRDVIRLANASDRVDFLREFGAEAVHKALPIIAEGPIEERAIGGVFHEYQVITINVGEDDSPVVNPYLRMTNPSTGETCIEAVSPACRTVDDALRFRNGTADLPHTLT